MAVKSTYVIDDLRKRIVEGVYPAGSQLPTRLALQAQYGTTPVTLQRSFRQLIHEGFVETRPREGTFVSRHPPHRSRFVLVFPFRETRFRPWPQFWRALMLAAQAQADGKGRTIHLAFGNETHEDRDAYEELVTTVLTHRLAGLIFASPPFYMQGSPVLESGDIPRVAIMEQDYPPHVRAVRLAPGLIEAAARKLLALGCRKIAVISAPRQSQALAHSFQALGLVLPPYWIQTASVEAAFSVRAAVHLLMTATQDRRPDSLLILDDNLVPHATAGLLDAGVRVPTQLHVVAHANFPYMTPSAVPAYRIGYDANAIITACLQVIEHEHTGVHDDAPAEIPLVCDDRLHEAQPCVAVAGEHPDGHAPY